MCKTIPFKDVVQTTACSQQQKLTCHVVYQCNAKTDLTGLTDITNPSRISWRYLKKYGQEPLARWSISCAMETLNKHWFFKETQTLLLWFHWTHFELAFLVTIKQTGCFWTLRSSLQVGYFFTSSWFVSHSKLVGFLLQVSWFITSKWLPVKTERLS